MPLATALEEGLERYAKPLFKMRALEIYRDTESQILTPDLLAAVHQAMDQSEHLILLASPESAASPWVPKELLHWCENHGLDKLIIVLCAGTIAWDEEAGDFDWDKTDALPKVLSGYFSGSPLYLDMSWARGRSDLNFHNPDFKQAISRLSATLNGMSIGDMYSEEARQFKRTRRIKNATIAGLSTLLVASLIAGTMAYVARNDAIYQRNVAIKKNLVNEVRNQLNDNEFIKALQIARAARKVYGDDPETNSILWQLVSHPTTTLAEWPDAYADTAEVSDDHEWVMIWTENTDVTNDVIVRNWRTGREVRRGGIFNAWFIDDNSKILEVTIDSADPSSQKLESHCPQGRTVYANGEWTRMHVRSRVVDLATGQTVAWPGEAQPEGFEQAPYNGKVDPNWSGSMAEMCGNTVQMFSSEGEFTGNFDVDEGSWVLPDHKGEIFAISTRAGVALYNPNGELMASLDGQFPVFSEDGQFVATTIYGVYPFDFKTYAMGVTHPAIDEKLAYLLRDLSAHDLDESIDQEFEEEQQFESGYTIIWRTDGTEHMRVPGVDPVFSKQGVFTVGGFEFDGYADDDLRLWGLTPVFDGGPYDREGGRAPFVMELEGIEPLLSPDGRWISTLFDGGSNIYMSDGTFSRHIPGEAAAFLGDLPILLTQSDSWTRLWYLPRASNDITRNFVVPTDRDFAVDHCLGVPYGEESQSGYYVTYPEEYWLFECDSMPPSMPSALGSMMPMQITRPLAKGGFETISIDTPACHVVMERYHENLYLMSCGEGLISLIDLDAIKPDQPENDVYDRWFGERLIGAVFSPDGRYIAASSSYGTIKLWKTRDFLDRSNGNVIEFANESDAHTLLFSPDSSWLLTASYHGPIKLFDLNGNELTRSEPPQAGFEIVDVMFSEDGKMLHVRLTHETETDSYWNRSIDFDALIDEFSWIPDLDVDERIELGLPEEPG